MTYQEIMRIDTEPFDIDVLEEIYDGYSGITISAVYALILFHYYRKFDQVYGTNLTACVDIPRGLINERMELDMDQDDTTVYWYETAPVLLDAAMLESGWNQFWIDMNDELICAAFDHSDTPKDCKETFHQNYTRYLDENLEDCLVKTACRREEDTLYEAREYLESGYMGIFWNEQLTDYMNFRRKSREVVQAACPEEDAAIARLEEEVWEPYGMFLVEKKENVEDWAYGVVVIGCDGYNWTDHSSINPNWIPAAIKLKMLLDLAMEKIRRYREQEKAVLAA